LVSQVDGRRLDVGDLEMVALGKLRQRARACTAYGAGRLTMRVVTGNVRDLHTDASNAPRCSKWLLSSICWRWWRLTYVRELG
jgi:hypothetical protein